MCSSGSTTLTAELQSTYIGTPHSVLHWNKRHVHGRPNLLIRKDSMFLLEKMYCQNMTWLYHVDLFGELIHLATYVHGCTVCCLYIWCTLSLMGVTN